MLPDGHVYNLEVEGNHNYFVDDVLVHNCHHAVASTYKKIITKWPAARVLGVTATPCRTSGEGLGEIFDTLILGPTVAELTALNFLVPARIFSPPTMDTSGLHVRAGDYKTEEAEALADRPSVTGDALTHYRKHADGKRALAFTVSVKHAHNVAAQFRDAGVPAYALDGGTDKTIRRQALADFRDGKIRVLSSAEIFSEGLDVPAVEAGILLRPTASMGLYLQQVGRCLRPFHGKAQALILDHAANTQRFGLPSDDREWSLAGTEPSKRKKPATLSVRVCPACFAANRAGAPICTNCGAPFPVQAREVEERDGELTEITPEMLERRHQRKLQGRAQTLEQLREFGRSKNYAPGWADHIWAARQRKLQGTRHATLGNGRERIGSDRADTAGALEW
jgi:superfamily II DNA or RNA helicase